MSNLNKLVNENNEIDVSVVTAFIQNGFKLVCEELGTNKKSTISSFQINDKWDDNYIYIINGSGLKHELAFLETKTEYDIICEELGDDGLDSYVNHIESHARQGTDPESVENFINAYELQIIA